MLFAREPRLQVLGFVRDPGDAPGKITERIAYQSIRSNAKGADTAALAAWRKAELISIEIPDQPAYVPHPEP
jgi:hypothetical protein